MTVKENQFCDFQLLGLNLKNFKLLKVGRCKLFPWMQNCFENWWNGWIISMTFSKPNPSFLWFEWPVHFLLPTMDSDGALVGIRHCQRDTNWYYTVGGYCTKKYYSAWVHCHCWKRDVLSWLDKHEHGGTPQRYLNIHQHSRNGYNQASAQGCWASSYI